MGDQPFVLDPLDNKYINVGQSSIDTDEMSQEFKENGAFVKEDIPPQTVISHNNGYIVNQKEKTTYAQLCFAIEASIYFYNTKLGPSLHQIVLT